MKVVDLKTILQNANVPFDSKLTKPALIKKILETPSAVAVASAPEDSAGADDDLVSLALVCMPRHFFSNIFTPARLTT
jgi:hypothetical protein